MPGSVPRGPNKRSKKSVKKDTTDSCTALSTYPHGLMKFTRFDNMYKVRDNKLCFGTQNLDFIKCFSINTKLYFFLKVQFYRGEFFFCRPWQGTRVPRLSWDQKTQRSRTQMVLITTVWRRVSGSDPWTTCLVERRLWQLQRYCFQFTGQ